MVNRIRRYAQIMDVLGKYGFSIGLERLFPGEPGSGSRTGKSPDTSTVYERIRLALEELGPTFVKFGQIMSTRTELLPPEMIDQPKKLQDHAKPVPFSEIRGVLEKNCPNIDEIVLRRSMKYLLPRHRLPRYIPRCLKTEPESPLKYSDRESEK